jgi:hypothetical protein
MKLADRFKNPVTKKNYAASGTSPGIGGPLRGPFA